MDYGILNGRIYVEGKFIEGNLYIKDEKVSTITTAYLPCKKEFDAGNKLVLPGFIDPHVHFHLTVGANTSKDDFYTGSIAGSLGGVTTYIDFLDPVKASCQIEDAYRSRRLLAEESVTDYSFHTTIANPKDGAYHMIKESLKYGIPSVKLFTTYSNTDRRTYDNYIDSLLKVSKELKSRIVIHAENDYLINTDVNIPVKDHERSRPVISERTEILKLAEMSKDKDGLLYIVHVSAGSSVELLAKNYGEELKKRNILLESCPHYFLFNSENYERQEGYLYTMTPPLREEKERQLINRYIDELTVIGTDHCPFDSDLKRQAYTASIPMGVGGISYSFVTMYGLFGTKIIPKFTKGPAEAYGLYPRKGTLLPGADADVVIFDDSLREEIKDNDSIYNGVMGGGRITDVFLRGMQLVEDGKLKKESEKKGRYLGRTIEI